MTQQPLDSALTHYIIHRHYNIYIFEINQSAILMNTHRYNSAEANFRSGFSSQIRVHLLSAASITALFRFSAFIGSLVRVFLLRSLARVKRTKLSVRFVNISIYCNRIWFFSCFILSVPGESGEIFAVCVWNPYNFTNIRFLISIHIGFLPLLIYRVTEGFVLILYKYLLVFLNFGRIGLFYRYN